jgi:hypothetical protein
MLDKKVMEEQLDEWWDLAKIATKRLSALAAECSAVKNPGRRERVLSELAGRLLMVYAILESPNASQQQIIFERLEKLLGHLETICIVSDSFSR